MNKILNKEEIFLLTEVYINKKHLNEVKFGNLFIDLKVKGQKLVEKLRSIKSFFKTAGAFNNFIKFLHKNKSRIMSVGIVTLMGMSVIACETSDTGELSRSIERDSILLSAEQEGALKYLTSEEKQKLKSGTAGILLTADGSYQIIHFESDIEKETETGDVNDLSPFSRIQQLKEDSINGIFFIDSKLQKSILKSIKEQLASIEFDNNKPKELSISVEGKVYTTYVVNLKDNIVFTNTQAAVIKDKFLSNFDSLKSKAIKALSEFRNKEHKNASDETIQRIWKKWREKYNDTLDNCLNDYVKNPRDTVKGFACSLNPIAKSLNEKLNGNLFPSVSFYRGDKDGLLETMRHELSHVIDDHFYQAAILNDFNDVMLDYFLPTDLNNITITEKGLKDVLQSSIKKQKSKHHNHDENINIDVLIEELLNSGQIKRSKDSKNKFIVYKRTDEYMSHYNEMRQHRIDSAILASTLGDSKEVKIILNSLRNLFKTINTLEKKNQKISLKGLFKEFDYNFKFKSFEKMIADYIDDNGINDVDDGFTSKKLLKIGKSLDHAQSKESMYRLLIRISQLTSGHDDNLESFSNEATTILAIYDVLSLDNNDNETFKKVSDTMHLSDLIQDDEKFEDLISSLFYDKSHVKFLDAKKKVDDILKVKELAKLFKTKFEKREKFKFDYKEIIEESNKNSYSLIKDYIRLLVT